MRQETWNNASDRYELVLTPPFTEIEVAREGFPAEAQSAAIDIIGFAAERFNALSQYPDLELAIKSSLEKNEFALVREAPTSEPDDTAEEYCRYFLSFGAADPEGRSSFLASIQLGLESPNWKTIQRNCGFPPPREFVDFAESFPGLCIGAIEFPEFLRPYSYFDNVRKCLPKINLEGQLAVSDALFRQLQRCIFFQSDYWSTFRFIGADGKVKELVHPHERLSDIPWF